MKNKTKIIFNIILFAISASLMFGFFFATLYCGFNHLIDEGMGYSWTCALFIWITDIMYNKIKV